MRALAIAINVTKLFNNYLYAMFRVCVCPCVYALVCVSYFQCCVCICVCRHGSMYVSVYACVRALAIAISVTKLFNNYLYAMFHVCVSMCICVGVC